MGRLGTSTSPEGIKCTKAKDMDKFLLSNLIEIVMNEMRRFKHSADFPTNSSHIIESAAISDS